MSDEEHPKLVWSEESREKESSFGIFDVYRVSRVSPEGQRGSFVVVDAPDWVTVIPIVKDSGNEESFLMVRQYRHGSQRVTLEFPAGVVEPGEEPHAAAARELLEETGYSADEVQEIGATNPNPSFMCNRTYTFVALGVEKAGQQALDSHELVEIETVPVAKVIVEMGTEGYDNAIMMSAMAYFLRWRPPSSERSRSRK